VFRSPIARYSPTPAVTGTNPHQLAPTHTNSHCRKESRIPPATGARHDQLFDYVTSGNAGLSSA
jgi:hypothetical protein